MFINEVITRPRYVEGRKFVERTINSKFKKANVTITTVYMDNKPILKQYTFDAENILKSFWKSLKRGYKVEEMTLDKNLNVIV